MTALSGPYESLLPPGAFEFNDALFEQLTRAEKRDIDTVPLPATGGGFGQPFRVRIPPSGVAARLILDFIGTITVTLNAGTVTVGPRWPYGFLETCDLRISGSTTDYSTTGLDLNTVRYMRHRNVTDSLDVSTVPTGGGTNNIRISWEVPFNLSPQTEPSGGLFTLSSNTELDLYCATSSLAEMFTTTGAPTITIAGNIVPRLVWYDVPTGVMSNGKQGMILPSLDHFMALKRQNLSVPGGGVQDLPLDHVDGTLMALWTRISNGALGAAFVAPTPGSIDKCGIRYSTSNIQLNPSTDQVMRDNDARYRGQPPFGTLVVLDGVDNLVRDSYQLSGLPDPKLEIAFNGATTINAGALAEICYQVLIPIATSTVS